MSFAELVEADIASVFLNPDEYGEEHIIDGKKVICVIDRDSDAPTEMRGVYSNTVRVFCKSSDINFPKTKRVVKIDGSEHLVVHVSNEFGMTVITAEENRS